jgi:hypothetical protein
MGSPVAPLQIKVNLVNGPNGTERTEFNYGSDDVMVASPSPFKRQESGGHEEEEEGTPVFLTSWQVR